MGAPAASELKREPGVSPGLPRSGKRERPRVATKTISGLYDGATTSELDRLSSQTAAALIAEEPDYARLAARLLSTYVDKEVRNQGIHAFTQSIAAASEAG